MTAPFWSKVRSYGESSRDSQSWSHTPSGAMRYTAPLGERRSSRAAPDDPDPPTSTTEIEVISADTDGIGALGSPRGRSIDSESVVGEAPALPARPFSAATYRSPFSLKW